MECPRPQPGQKSNPALRRGHKVKWLPSSRRNSASANIPPSQMSASQGRRRIRAIHKKLSPLNSQRADVSTLISGYSLSEHKTTVQNCLVLLGKAGITPPLKFVDLFSDQHSDGFPQLFFKEPGVKTHFGEHSLDVIEHSKNNLVTG